MTSRIDETLRKLAANTPSGNQPAAQPQDTAASPVATARQFSPGDPECPVCHGLGYVRYELPVGHPEFGRLHDCACRQAQIQQKVYQRLFAFSNLSELAHLTFDNFLPRGRVGVMPQHASSLEFAYNQASIYARTLKGWLVLLGGYGVGKTHLAAAVGNFAVSMGVQALFVTVPDLLDSLRTSFSDQENPYAERFEQILSVPLLILDDFGTQNATPWAQEKLFQIINHRYINKLPLVVTSNMPMNSIEGRIRSRLEDPELVHIVRIQSQDYRRPILDAGHHELSSLPMLTGRTFAHFDLRKGEGLEAQDLQSLERAFAVAREYAEAPRGWLVFIGPYGCGKTHLAAAIAHYRLDLGDQLVFISVPDLMDHLRATFAPTSMVSMDRLFDEVRTIPLLFLDDLGAQSPTPWVQEKLYQLFNYRYMAELPTVITTSSLKKDLDQRILSRMDDQRLCRVSAITVPSYRGLTPPQKSPPVRKRRSG